MKALFKLFLIYAVTCGFLGWFVLKDDPVRTKPVRPPVAAPVVERPPLIDLNAEVSVTALTVTVSNADSFDWSRVRMSIPSERMFDVLGYYHKLAAIRSGETVEIALLDFVDSKGKRFDGLSNQPQRIHAGR